MMYDIMIPTMLNASFKDKMMAELIYQKSNAESMLEDYEMMNKTNSDKYLEVLGYYAAIQNMLDFAQKSDNMNVSIN